MIEILHHLIYANMYYTTKFLVLFGLYKVIQNLLSSAVGASKEEPGSGGRAAQRESLGNPGL